MIKYFKQKYNIDDNIIYFILISLIICICICITSFKCYEGFNNMDGCKKLISMHKIVNKTLDAIPKKSTNPREQINNGMNYREMQTRDIIIGDERSSWCMRLSTNDFLKVKKAIEKELDTEIMLYDATHVVNDNSINFSNYEEK